MSKFHGKNGKVEWRTDAATSKIIANCTGWTSSISCETADSTVLAGATAANNFRQKLGGVFNWGGTFEINVDSTPDILLASDFGVDFVTGAIHCAVALYLKALAGQLQILTGDVVLTGYAPTASHDEVTKTVCTFQGTDPVTYEVADPAWIS